MSSQRPRVVLVCRCLVINEEGRLLLMQRAHTDSHDADLWEVPGGKLDEGQELEEALKREVMEEASIEVEVISPLAFTRSYVIPDGKYAGLPYVRLYYIGRLRSGEVKLSYEHDEFKWVTLDELSDFALIEDVLDAVGALRPQLEELMQNR